MHSVWTSTDGRPIGHGVAIKRKPAPSIHLTEAAPLVSDDTYQVPTKDFLPSRPSKNIKAFHWWWWWEIAAAFLSITSMCLIIAVLFHVQNRPLAKWTWNIQPSSVISVLTTIGKTAMMVPITACLSQLKWRHVQLRPRPLNHLQVFDDASRGPWGSAVMAWKLPSQSFLGCALAFVTIVALGIEPSAQNILDFPILEWNATTDLAANLAKADIYFSKGFLQLRGNNWQLWVPNSDLPNFQAALLNGLSGAVFEPNYDCPGTATRCSWTNFTSLGVCSSFRDVTVQSTRNCTVIKKNDSVQNCSYVIPGRMSSDRPVLQYYNNGPASLKDSQILYSDFDFDVERVGQLTIVRHSTDKWPEDFVPPSPEIFLADFDWCIKTYANTSATAGKLDSGTSESEILKFKEVIIDPDESSLGAESVVYQTSDNSTQFEMVRMAKEWLPRYLQNLLRGELFQQVAGHRPDKTPGPNTAMNLEFVLFNAADIKVVTDNLATTITNQIRSGSPGDNRNSTMLRGEVYKTETFVVVRWPWLILPVLETVVTAILLVISILMTAKGPLLKTSVIALLAYPLYGWADDETAVNGHQTAEKFDKLSQSLNGRLENGDGNWRFVKAQV
ncbi:uncharacterized protein CTRU02_205331 [Colletotrichum truncatum]|uniref:Uncharacterized protein n=1 Tax=Colletotrichum truncatum TaxID=5467 RepID=A0ACC3Z3P5_COLTU